jgi:hypothetical protein
MREGRSIQEQLDGLSIDALAFANLVAQVKWRAMSHPEFFLQLPEDCFRFFLGEGHDEFSTATVP